MEEGPGSHRVGLVATVRTLVFIHYVTRSHSRILSKGML